MSELTAGEKNKCQVEKLTYNTHEACQALGVSVTTLWRLEKRGFINPISGGLRMKLYSVQALRRFVEQSGRAV